MINFFVHDHNGRIMMSGTCPKDQLHLQGIPGMTTVEGRADHNTEYVDSLGKLRKIPNRPRPIYAFNWETKQWYDPRSLDEVKSWQWAKIKVARDKAEFGVFPWGSHSIQCDAASQARIDREVSRAAQAKLIDAPYFNTWTTANNTIVDMDAEHMLSMGYALANHVNSVFAKGKRIRAQIDAAESIEAVESIVWD